jgi:hypothetical protein
MPVAPPRWAAETEVIRRLEAEWRVIASSWWFRRRLHTWAATDPRLAFDDGHRLVGEAQRRDATSWADRDQVLAALLDRLSDDPVARRVALQVVLPGVKSLIDGIRGWDIEERAARVVAAALDVLAHCAVEPAGTPPSFRVFANTRRRALRAAIRDRSEPVVLIDDFSHFEDAGEPEMASRDEERWLEELVEWVRERGRLRDETARMVVLTRPGGVSPWTSWQPSPAFTHKRCVSSGCGPNSDSATACPSLGENDEGHVQNVMADGTTGDADGMAWAHDELFHHELPAAISRWFTAGTPPGSMSRAITATADVLADLFVDLVERWHVLDEDDRIFQVVVHVAVLRELEHLTKLGDVIGESTPTRTRT